MSSDPPFYPICSKRVAIDWTGAEDSDDKFKIPWKLPREKLEIPHKVTKTLPGPPPPPCFDPYIYQSISFELKIPNKLNVYDRFVRTKDHLKQLINFQFQS
jgi:hypothetical protein